ncbi:PspC domain-containing protein [Rhodococcus sp. HNM0569]|uniref:PspC domain-containing protein n=1 Tax=Rhodococcus sp. HNM0569 TaxID=2716340 RepID=UPI00146BA811|nr:PspC domain-containing protein [Rhodococcus sp. HNM0569]NLU83124.1 PspC domain-containing protein [Rhodococcus sp. HNM0569]
MTYQDSPRRFTRSTTDRKIAGVCGGAARYFGVDANLIRLLMVVATLVSAGSALVVYAAGWLLMPEA